MAATEEKPAASTVDAEQLVVGAAESERQPASAATPAPAGPDPAAEPAPDSKTEPKTDPAPASKTESETKETDPKEPLSPAAAPAATSPPPAAAPQKGALRHPRVEAIEANLRKQVALEESQASPTDDDDSLSLTESEFQNSKQLNISTDGLETRVALTDHGLDVDINEKSKLFASLLAPAFDSQIEAAIPSYLAHHTSAATPSLNIVIQIVGSRGDVQPFVSLGKVLHQKYGHRVRIATHFIFKSFVEENGLEFFNIGGDPAELMAFMVHNPGLIPDVATIRSGEVGKRRIGTFEMLVGCWRSCIEAGDGTGSPIFEAKRQKEDGVPFVADAIIANPPSFAHIHCAEKLGIPLHLMFTMPWSPTKSFPHPLVNIKSTNADGDQTNFMSYALVEMMTWQGLGDVINKFRRTILNLQDISLMWAPGMNSRLRIPFTYCWSPALIPKPKDWGPHISISGFFFLDLATSFTPPPELLDFLAAGPPPVYIGFGSIVVDDPDAMTEMIFSAVKKLGIRALVSKGWGGLGGDALQIPENIYMLGNVPHDWLFQSVSAVVHHGGAGTTAAGIAAGRPTVVVPFFGDQPFWGAMIARAGAGPMPIPFKQLNVDNLVSQLQFALKPETLQMAKVLGEKMAQEHGANEGANLFHAQLGNEMRCSVLPERTAVWKVKKTDLRLSSLAATVLINRGLVDLKNLKLHRPREYQLEDGPWDPVSGVTSALIGTLGSLAMGVADLHTEFYHGLKTHIDHQKARSTHSSFRSPFTTNNNSTASLGTSNTIESQNLAATSKERDNSTVSLPLTSTDKEEKVDEGFEKKWEKAAAKPHDDGSATLFRNENLDAINKPVPPASILAKVAADNAALKAAKADKDFIASPPSRSSTILDRSDPTSPVSPHQLLKKRPTHFTTSTAHAAEWIIKGPMDVLDALSGGFHNAPKLYGDTTVRHATPVSGMQSGLKAAGKDFAHGVIDGVSGLVTQPIQGAKNNGVAGLFSGVVKGFGGLVLKPVSGVTNIPVNILKGVYKELEKSTDFCLQTHVMLSRVAQGLGEVEAMGDSRDGEIVAKWKVALKEAADRKKENTRAAAVKRQVCHGLHFQKAAHMTYGEAAMHAEEKGLRRKSVISAPAPAPKSTRVSDLQETEEQGGTDSDASSIVSTDSDDHIEPKMEVKVGEKALVKHHMTMKDMVIRLKGNEHHGHHLFHRKHAKGTAVAV